MPLSREDLIRSLDRQRERLADSIVLTPVDSLPFSLADRAHTDFLHGLYLTDKVRDRDASRAAVIQFAGRDEAARDLAAIHDVLASALGAAAGSLRLLAGLQAHAAVFMSIASIGQTVALLSEEAGGHFNTHDILRRLGLRTIDLPVDFDRLCIDRRRAAALINEAQPDFVFIDRSEGLRYEDFSFLAALEGPTTIFDASQYLPGILTGRYANPLTSGFDLMLFSLHKSFPGPQKGGVVTRARDSRWDQLLQGLSTFVSSSHAESTYLTGLTLLRDDWLKTYASRLHATAIELEAQLITRGIDAVRRSDQGDPDWPATHHIWIRAGNRDEAYRHYEWLAAVNIQTNYRKLPYRLGYGLRLGTSFAAVAGIDVEHVGELAEIIATTLRSGPSDELRLKVQSLARRSSQGAILSLEDLGPQRVTILA